MEHEITNPRSRVGRRQYIRHFHHNPVGREETCAEISGEGYHPIVVLVATIQSSNEIK